MHDVARTPPAEPHTPVVAPLGLLVAVGLLLGVMCALGLARVLPGGLAVFIGIVGLVAWARPSWRGTGRRRDASPPAPQTRASTAPWPSAAAAVGRFVGAVLVGMALASLHAAAALDVRLPSRLEQAQVQVTGRIVDLPVHEARRTRFHFRVDETVSEPAIRGRLLRLAWYEQAHSDDAHVPRLSLRAGQRWSLLVRLRAPRGLRNPGAPDSEMYALAARLSASGYVRAPQQARLLSPAAGLAAWREAMSARIAAAVPATSSRFLRALTLGDTRALDDADWTTLRANGLTHLIAISGFHVGLVAGFAALVVRGLWWALPALARRCPAPVAAALGAMMGAFAYAAVAGFALPTLRTALMIAVVAGARAWRRPLRGHAALALALVAVLLADPLAVLGAGFWLSFAGVAWLLWCLPRTSGDLFRDFLSAQGVATLGLLPLGVALFGQASLAGPFANLVAIPWWSLVVVPLSLIGLLLECAVPGSGVVIWRVAAWCFDLSWPLFDALGRSDLAVWWLPEAGGLALASALLGAFWLLLPRGMPGKGLALLLWLPLLWPDRDLPRAGEVELTVIDVGQGLSVLVRTSGHALLYDMGPAVTDGFDAGERAVTPTLHALGVRRLDRVVVSHADNDHAGGYQAVMHEFPIGSAWAPEESPSPPGNHRCQAGLSWTWDGVRLEFLHPTAHFPYLGNESSCVLQIRSKQGVALLTGDIGEVIERRLVERHGAALRADVVVVAHHGSDGSSDASFIAATRPRLALVSTGHGNRFGHPRAQVMARWRRAGAHTADTARGGALRVGLRAGGVTLETRRDAQLRLWDAAARP